MVRLVSSTFVALFSATPSPSTTALKALPSYLERQSILLADSVRRKIRTPTPSLQNVDELSYPSLYTKPNGSMRGFCNWVIPNKLMVGQYPGQTPERDGPSADDAESHIESIICDTGVSFFCSLQSELPAQDDDSRWEACGGRVFLPEQQRRAFPHAFSHYGPTARAVSSEAGPVFHHAPIVDLDVPDSDDFLQLLTTLLEAMKADRAVYLHCWGGRGRAGLVGACLLSLLYPELDAPEVLGIIQAGYETRAGAENMPEPLSRSPQTDGQRQFVRNFVAARRRLSKMA